LLGPVKLFDVGVSRLEGRQHLRINGPVSSRDLLRGGLQVAQGEIGLELPVLPQRFGVPIPAQRCQDGSHLGQHLAHVSPGAHEDGLPPGRGKPLQVFDLQTCHAQAPPFRAIRSWQKKLYRIVAEITN